MTLFSNSSCLCVSSKWTIKGPLNVESYTVLLAGAQDPLNFWNRPLGRFQLWSMLAWENAKKLVQIINLMLISLNLDSWCLSFLTFFLSWVFSCDYYDKAVSEYQENLWFSCAGTVWKLWKTIAQSHNLDKKILALKAYATCQPCRLTIFEMVRPKSDHLFSLVVD